MVRHCREVNRRENGFATIAILEISGKAPFCDPQSEPYLGTKLFAN
jgi:hypothetical protein